MAISSTKLIAKNRTAESDMFFGKHHKCLVRVGVLVPALLLTTPIAVSQTPDQSHRTAVLVELFTSEGCSSCPSADKLLNELKKKQPLAAIEIIPLAEHVDYWDRLGWKDKFASKTLTTRQYDFAHAMKKPQVYTPQAIVDGCFECVGNDYAQLTQAIKKSATRKKEAIEVSYKLMGKKVMINGKLTGPRSDESRQGRIYYAVFASGEIRSDVKSGENRGHLLVHDSIASNLTQMNNSVTGDQLSALVALPTIKPDRVIVFGESVTDKTIVAIGSTRFVAQVK